MLIIGHRGARGLAPENTLVSLQKAIEHHVDEIECDVRVTKDGVVILHHDPFVTDPNGERHVIADYTYAALLERKTDLTTLEAVLKTLTPGPRLHIEVKPDEPTAQIVAVLKKYVGRQWQPEKILLASFSQRTLLELQVALPDIEKIVIESWSGVRATYRARQLNTKRISMNQKWLWFGFVRPMAQRGWLLCAYTLNDPQKAARWHKHGLYGVVTDYPDRFSS